MLAQISPGEDDYDESLCTLAFASRVRATELGGAVGAAAPAKKKAAKAKAQAAAVAASAAFYISSQAAANSRAGDAGVSVDAETSLWLSPRAGSGGGRSKAAALSPTRSSPGPASLSPPRGSSSGAPAGVAEDVLNTPGAAAMVSMEEGGGFDTSGSAEEEKSRGATAASSQQHHLDHLLNADPVPAPAPPPVPQSPKIVHMKLSAPTKAKASGDGVAAAAAPLVVYVDPTPASGGSPDLQLNKSKSTSKGKGMSLAAAQLPLPLGGLYAKVAAMEAAERNAKENHQAGGGPPTRQARSKQKERAPLQVGDTDTVAGATAATAGELCLPLPCGPDARPLAPLATLSSCMHAVQPSGVLTSLCR